MGSPARGGSPQRDSTPRSGMSRMLECGNFDVQEVQRIGHVLLLTLAEACVQKTAGDPFKAPSSVVGEVKKDMLDYLQQQSEFYANSGAGTPAGASIDKVDPPSKVVEDLLEQFVKGKQNLFGKMSSRIKLSSKDDKVDALVQELDRGGVWMPGRREVLARALVKRIDRAKVKHCPRKFEREEELHAHRSQCPIRPVTCINDGCKEMFSALYGESHDALCLYKQLPCRQKCNTLVRRGEMEVHVATVCPMKLVGCPFEKLGCVEPVYQGNLGHHCSEYVPKHLMQMLSAMQKQEGMAFNHSDRISLLEKAINIHARSEAVDVKNLTLSLKEAEMKIDALERETKQLRESLRSTDTVSADMLQLRREVARLQKQGAAHQQLLQNPMQPGFPYPGPRPGQPGAYGLSN